MIEKERDQRSFQMGLRIYERGLSVCQIGLRLAIKVLRLVRRGVRASHWEDERTYRINFSPCFKTLFPILAAA